MTMSARAATLAESSLTTLGRRWVHVQAVATRARTLSEGLAPDEQEIVVTAAWLHDVGYGPDIRDSGFHPLDGARYLRANDWPEVVVNLVAHHSAAQFEAAERGLTDQLTEFPAAPHLLQDALDTADLTTGPDGQVMSFDERMDEILKRYPPGDPVHEFWLKALPVQAQTVRRTHERLSNAQPK